MIILIIGNVYLFTCTSLPVYDFFIQELFFKVGSRISGNGAHMYKGVGVQFADFVSFSQNIL